MGSNAIYHPDENPLAPHSDNRGVEFFAVQALIKAVIKSGHTTLTADLSGFTYNGKNYGDWKIVVARQTDKETD